MAGKIRNQVGPWVIGDDCWGREPELTQIIDLLEEGNHVNLAGPRRIGKTSVAREAARRLEGRYITLFVDLQNARSAPDAVAALGVAMHKQKSLWIKAKETFKNILNTVSEAVDRISAGDLEVTLRAGLSAGQWQGKGNELFSILATVDKPVLVIFDEMAIMLAHMLKGDDYMVTTQRRGAVTEFLNWLRHNILCHQGKTRIVVSGSVSLASILHQARSSAAMNMLFPLTIEAWDEPTALGFLVVLGEQYDVTFDEAVPLEILKRLKCCIPYHVQLFFQHIRTDCARRSHARVTKRDVGRVYASAMLGVEGDAALMHYEERLKMVLGEEILPLALDMASEAAVVGKLTPESLSAFQRFHVLADRAFAEAQREVLDVLVHDGYLVAKSTGYVFVSRYLRDWWKKRYRLSFEPVLKRSTR